MEEYWTTVAWTSLCCVQGNAAAAVDLLMPLRYDVVRIGGSDAQVR